MNVLGKLVIPRTEVTIIYIGIELEENARNEFNRLKKIIELKRKKLVKCKQIGQLITCPICLKLKAKDKAVEEKCIICGVSLDTEELLSELNLEEAAEERMKLEQLKDHISDVVEITVNIKSKDELKANVNDFLRTAKDLKEKLDQEKDELVKLEFIPSNVDFNKLCDICKKGYYKEHPEKEYQTSGEDELERKQSQHASLLSRNQTKEHTKSIHTSVSELCPLHSAVETDLELGVFETDIKHITKIIQVRQEDGTVIEERKVIKIKKELRTPIKANNTKALLSVRSTDGSNRIMFQSSDTSVKSIAYSDKKTIGIVTIRQSTPYIRKVHSELIPQIPMLINPIVRCCMSLNSIMPLEVDLNSNFDTNTMHNEVLPTPMREMFK